MKPLIPQLSFFRWAELSPSSHRVLIPLACLAILVLLQVERGRHLERSPQYESMMVASERASVAARHLKDLRLERGIFVDPINDPAETALIGQDVTQITTDQGSLEAKLATTNPNFAAVTVDMLAELGIEAGDCAAVAMTGSYPGLNIAVLAALETLAIKPVVISSVGSSNFGANDPTFTWLDMERELAQAGILSTTSAAASLGGGRDQGRGLSPLGRDLLQAAIDRNDVFAIAPASFQAKVAQRVDLYEHHCGPSSIAVYINIGGGVASLGHWLNGDLIPPGPSRFLPARNYPARGALLEIARRGVPIIHFSNIRQLSERYGLTSAEEKVPAVGVGAVYARERYDLSTAWAGLGVLLACLAVLAQIDRHAHRLGNEPVDPQGKGTSHEDSLEETGVHHLDTVYPLLHPGHPTAASAGGGTRDLG